MRGTPTNIARRGHRALLRKRVSTAPRGLLFATASLFQRRTRRKRKKTPAQGTRHTSHTTKEWIPTHNKTSGVGSQAIQERHRTTGNPVLRHTHCGGKEGGALLYCARARTRRKVWARNRAWGRGRGNVTEARYVLYHSQYDRMIATSQSIKLLFRSVSHILLLLLPLHPTVSTAANTARSGGRYIVDYTRRAKFPRVPLELLTSSSSLISSFEAPSVSIESS